jgi:hypothetical protein
MLFDYGQNAALRFQRIGNSSFLEMIDMLATNKIDFYSCVRDVNYKIKSVDIELLTLN